MADSQKVRADSRLLWDNVHPALEAIVTNGVADVEFPDTTNGMKMAIDMSQVLKEICYDFDDLVFEFHLTDKPVRYFTGKADVAKEKAMHFYPVNCYSKRFDKSYFSVDIRKKDSSILSSECIEIEGVTMDPSEARVFEDWFLLQRLADRAPRPLAKESAINFVHPTYLTNQLQTCLYYYRSCSTQEPDKQSISSRLNIPASDDVYEFLH
ncbi:MAG: hypothetical protein NTY99_01075, partial [DPANN group archaeon]|nr:hypothetical protein [DPANN group archaeon]